MDKNRNYYAVIMAGGIGSRFWPISKKSFPKQFHDILGTGQTLIQKTFMRLRRSIPSENILILTNSLYEHMVKEQLPEVAEAQIILEPEMRNTAPCILLAALKIQKENKNAVMVVAPSDHWIENEKAFASDIEQVFEAAAKEDWLMTLGIRPTFPNTGYGYLGYEKNKGVPVKKVLNFVEKPKYSRAKALLEEGNYLWNSGIFIWKASAIIQAFKQYLPTTYRLFYEGYSLLGTSHERNYIKNQYGKAESISVDYGIMEKSDAVYVLPASFDWNDLGTWGALYNQMPKDRQHNAVVNAKTYLENTSHNMLRTQEGKIVAIKGLHNFIVVEDAEVLLIYPREDEQEIKKIRADVKEKFGDDLV